VRIVKGSSGGIVQFIKSAWEKWKRIAHRIFMFQTAVVMTIFYFTVVFVGSVGGTILGKDPLKMKKVPGSTYLPHEPAPDTVERYMHLS
jgi:hypothetical protein